MSELSEVHMDKVKNLLKLLYEIEGCFKCYDKFASYAPEYKMRIRNWCYRGL